MEIVIDPYPSANEIENSTCTTSRFNFMRPKTNETKENMIDSSNLVSGPSYISSNSDAEIMIRRQMKMIAIVMRTIRILN